MVPPDAHPRIHPVWERRGGRVHAFLLDAGEDGLILIDALYAKDGSTVLAKLAQLGRPPSDIAHIVLTHAHRSHIGGVAALKRASGATVWAERGEADIVAGILNATRVSIMPRRPFRVLHLQLGLALGFGRDHPAVPVDRELAPGARIGPLEAIPTPGHTPGCYSFAWEESGALFVGDIMATWPRVEAGWRGLTLDDPANRRSLSALADVGEVGFVGVGHGAPLRGECAPVIGSVLAGRRLPGLSLPPPINP